MAFLLTVAGVLFLPYSAAGVLGAVFAFCILISRPDIAFALFIAVEALISEDVLLITEELAPTLYFIPIPGLGINVFEAALLVLIITTVLYRRGRLYGTPLDLSIFLFGLSCIIGYFTMIQFMGDPSRLFEPRRILHLFIGYFLAVNLLRTRDSLRMFLTIFFLAIVLKSLEGVWLYSSGGGLQIKWRIRAIFTGWEDSLNFVTYLMFMAIFLLEKVEMPLKRFFLWMSPFVFFSMLVSYKRAYYLAFIVAMCVVFLLQGKRARFRFFLLLLAAALIFAGALTAAGQWEAFAMRFGSIFTPTKESSAHYRIIEWRNALISIEKNPVTGIGLGGVMPMVIYIPRTNQLGVHNTFLWVTVKMGVFGLFTYLLLNLCYVRQLFRQNSHLHDPYLRAVSKSIFCAFIAFTTAEMFAPMFSTMRTSMWLGIMLGIGMLVGYLDLEERKQKTDHS
ncbi:MAG: O-antigen ligase family protein [bacterium]